ncbi:LexA family protein [Enterovibrio norvegicus]|uniref:LexA family protein n=1 Tax=Enterovibrio norvegicus TaxID=188144 RepID=UPI0024B2571D|nr:S24 family peptidase [Enterovibrio norvegicus]
MKTIADRLLYARKQRGITQKSLANAAGVTRVGISNIELSVSSGIRAETLFAIGKALGKNPEWLLHGTGPEESGSESTISSNGRSENSRVIHYPLISWDVLSSDLSIEGFDSKEMHPCPTDCGPNTFILIVRGDSMAERFNEGDWIYVDPDKTEVIHGRFVIAKTRESNSATFKQLQDLDGQTLLKALNTNYPSDLRYTRLDESSQILGTVVAHVRPV